MQGLVIIFYTSENASYILGMYFFYAVFNWEHAVLNIQGSNCVILGSTIDQSLTLMLEAAGD